MGERGEWEEEEGDKDPEEEVAGGTCSIGLIVTFLLTYFLTEKGLDGGVCEESEQNRRGSGGRRRTGRGGERKALEGGEGEIEPERGDRRRVTVLERSCMSE